MNFKKVLLLLSIFICTMESTFSQGIIADHKCTNIQEIPESAIMTAKENLHIAYGHTSHGSQIITGMNNLDNFMGGTGLYEWNDGTREGYLDIDDYFVSGDLGNPDRTTWATRTRDYLNNSNHSDVNVVMWSWCGQASSASEEDINTYLNLMTQLEIDFPNVKFIYMTGHLDGSGLTGNLHLRNEQIRNYCRTNNKILFDFADIECYDPDGNYYGDKSPNDNCDYDSDGNGSRDANWATDWQNSHTEGTDWYSCSAAHSQALNGNQKAYVAWWLWSTLAGWESVTSTEIGSKIINKIKLENNYPNPFNPTTNISFRITENSDIKLEIFNSLGEKVLTLINQNLSAGDHSVTWNANDYLGNGVNSGIYYYRISGDNFIATKRMVLLK